MGKKSKSNNKQIKKILTGIISVIVLIILAIVGSNSELIDTISKQLNINLGETQELTNIEKQNDNQAIMTDNLKIYFIDVGQADSILIINKDKSMLIDAGNNGDGKKVVEFIKEKKISKLDYLIGTHPHEDHIGGLDNVINSFEIENVYMPKIETTTKTFEDVLDAISNKGLNITAPKKGDTFEIGDATCEIMTDAILDKNNLNLSSITIKLQFGNNSFLFMGDAETKNEDTRQWEKVDVLKVAHHGSTTSSGVKFINQVKPEIAIIMVGKNNSYKLPKEEVLNRLKDVNSTIYRTDITGSIEMICDGNEIIVNTKEQ